MTISATHMWVIIVAVAITVVLPAVLFGHHRSCIVMDRILPILDAYPAYFIPPSHYSVDQARYDYDKAQNHCCGCPNHTCHQRDDCSSVTEERKSEKVQDRDSIGLIRLPNYPSPVVWVPTSSIKGREGDVASQLQPGC